MASPRPRDSGVVAALGQRCGAGSATTLTNFAWFAVRRGAFDAALDAVRRAVALPHAPPAAYRSLERIAAGHSDGLLLAIEPGDAAPPVMPASSNPLAAAVAAHHHAEWSVAEACYRSALGDPALAPAAWNGLAVLHEQRGERGAAERAWAGADAESRPAARHNRALALLRRGSTAAARQLLGGVTGRGIAALDYLAGYAALTAHDAVAAVALLETAVRIDADMSRALFTLGLARERVGDHLGAVDATRRALLLSPWYVPEVWLLERGGGAPWLELAAEAPSRRGQAPADEVLLALGRSLLERGHLGEALAVFDQVLMQHTSQPAALFHRGVVLAKLRRYAEALDDWAAVEQTDPDGALGAMSRRHAQSARQLAALFPRR